MTCDLIMEQTIQSQSANNSHQVSSAIMNNIVYFMKLDLILK